MFNIRVGPDGLLRIEHVLEKYFDATRRRISQEDKIALIADFDYEVSQNGIEHLKVLGYSIDGQEMRFVEMPYSVLNEKLSHILVLTSRWTYKDFAKIRDTLIAANEIFEDGSQSMIRFHFLPSFAIRVSYSAERTYAKSVNSIHPT